MSAQEAAGAIHTDFYDKFIRAEVVGYRDFVENAGSFAKVKEKGLLETRREGIYRPGRRYNIDTS